MSVAAQEEPSAAKRLNCPYFEISRPPSTALLWLITIVTVAVITNVIAGVFVVDVSAM